jgi:DNA-binding MarR family transcriptional regulator
MAERAYPGHGKFLPYLINKTATLINVRLQGVLEQYGFTLTHWRVLAFLDGQDGLTMGALAEATMTEQSTLSRSVRVLEDGGLVRRQASPTDSRAMHVYFNAKGRRVFDEILAQALQAEAELLRGVSASEAAALRSVLMRIIGNCQA